MRISYFYFRFHFTEVVFGDFSHLKTTTTDYGYRKVVKYKTSTDCDSL